MSKSALRVTWIAAAVAVAGLSGPAVAQNAPSGAALPSGPRQGPPPAAVEACRGAAPNDACRITGRYGERITGSCARVGEQLACVPSDGPPADRR